MDKEHKSNKTAIAAAYIRTTQVIMIAAIFVYIILIMISNNEGMGIESTIAFLCLILLSVIVNCYLTFRYINLIDKNNKYYNSLTETNSQLENLNNTLRSQRHDFMNHLQVVYSLIEMDAYNDARDYIEKVYGDIQRVNRALKTSIPAINALIQAKAITAEKSDIAVRINVTTPLSKLPIPAWEFCRVLANLIDNGIFALQSMEKEHYRELCIEIYEDLKSYGFRIRNNGPAIPKEIQTKIFETGFTTKEEKGEGMGLSIIKGIMQQYHGEIQVYSDQHFTEFAGCIPKALDQIE